MRRPTKATAATQARPSLWPMAFLLLAASLMLGACNTMSGVGEDVSAAGETLDQTSERTQDKISDEDTKRSDDYQAGRY